MAVMPNALIGTLQTISIRVSGLKRKLGLAKKGPREFSTVLRVPADSLVEDLDESVIEAEPGMEDINLLTVPGKIANMI